MGSTWRWKILLPPVPVLQGNQEHIITKEKVFRHLLRTSVESFFPVRTRGLFSSEILFASIIGNLSEITL